MDLTKAPKIYPAKYQFSAKDLKRVGQYVENMIPSTGSTLLFGAAGVGKTTVACNLMNAVATNQQFLGRNTNRTNCMFLSLDTPEPIVLERWLTNKPPFQQQFAFVDGSPGFDTLHPQFQDTQFYRSIAEYVRENKIGLVVVDSLRDCFNGEMNADSTPQHVYSEFAKWLDRAAVIFIHHTRKPQFANGKQVEGNVDDEATGSKYWINKAQTALYLNPVREDVLKLRMGKSQCFRQWEEPILLEMSGMDVAEWSGKTAAYTATYNAAFAHCQTTVPDWHNLSKMDRDREVAKHLGVSPRTVRRMEAAAKNLIK